VHYILIQHIITGNPVNQVIERVRFKDLNIETIDVEQGIRQTLDKKPLDELKSSIMQHGLLKPLLEPSVTGMYKLQIRKRSMADAKLAGLEKVPVIILDGPLEPKNSLTMRIVENLHREDLDPIDEV